MSTPSVLFALVSGTPGGGQRIAATMARALRSRNSRIGVVSPDGGTMVELFREIGAEIHIVGSLRSHRLDKIISLGSRWRGWDVLYTHTVPVQEGIVSAAGRVAGCRVVLHRHSIGSVSTRPGRSWYQMMLWQHALKSAAAIVAVSRHTAEQAERIGSRPVNVVPNGVPIPEPAVARDSDGRPPSVGFIGRLDPNKRVEDFLGACAILRDLQVNASFAIVGGGLADSGYEFFLESTAARLGLASGIFVGPVPNADGWLRDIDIVVIPSALEGHPMILLEAMALGKAIVATDIPGIADTVRDGSEAILVPVGQPSALAHAIRALIDSPSYRVQLGNAARARALAQFSEERMVEQLLPIVLGA